MRTLVIKLADGVVMKYKTARDIEEAFEDSENFVSLVNSRAVRGFLIITFAQVIQTAQTARSLRHIGLPNDLFGPYVWRTS